MDERPRWAAHLPAGFDPADVDLLAAESLPRAWAEKWAEHPERPALHDATEGWATRGALDRRTRASAGVLERLGLRPGDRLLLSATGSVALVAGYVAALRLGLVVVPANTGYREPEIAHIVRDARPSAAIVDTGERGEWIRRAAGDKQLPVLSPEALAAEGGDVGAPPDLDQATKDTPALICYTSGTTGEPKGAVLTHGNLLASAEAVRLAWRWTAEDRLLLTLPLFHLHGLGVGVNGTLLAGASAMIHEHFNVDAVFDAIAEHQATMFFGVPTMYTRLAASPRVAELSVLRLCVSGSAPLPASLHERLEAEANIRVLERYGMTETVMNVSNPHDGERRAGSVGVPLPGVDVELASRAEGEILLRGPNVFAGYWNRPDATAHSFTDDGWFRSGDIGRWDDDGFLHIVGRSKELIISGGYNVHPREVEDVLRQLSDVEDVAVVGEPSEEWGEVVTAYVVPTAVPDPDTLVAHARSQLAAYKVPRRIRFVSALPRNALGKVVKAELHPDLAEN